MDTDTQKFTEEELLIELSTFLDPTEMRMGRTAVADVFERLSNTEGVAEYLRNMMEMDMKRYFAASSDEQRAQIKGAYSRTAYLRSMIIGTTEAGKVKSVITGGRKSIQELQDGV